MTYDIYKEERPYATKFCCTPFAVQTFYTDYGRWPASRVELETLLKHKWPYAWKDQFLPYLPPQGEATDNRQPVLSGQHGGSGPGSAATIKAGR